MTKQQDEQAPQSFRLDNWPIRDVLLKLADATDHLLRDHDCDAHGYEQVSFATFAARMHASLLQQQPTSERCGKSPPLDDVLNMVWTNEVGVSVLVYKAANPRGEPDERRVIEIRKGEAVLASATVERHNRDSLAESISTTGLRYSPDEVARLVRAATTAAEGGEPRRIEIALGYIKRAASKELPKLPCRMDEMTEREQEIFKVGAAAIGTLQFIGREIDALEVRGDVAPAAAGESQPRDEGCAIGCGCPNDPWNQPSTTTSSDAAREAVQEITEWLFSGVAEENDRDRVVERLTTIIAHHFPSTEATQAAATQRLRDLDPLEFWQDLAEALGHPRPAKADVPALVSEVAELRGRLTTAGAEATQAAGDDAMELERLRRDYDQMLIDHCAEVNQLNTRLATARADAIRECVERAAGAVKPVGSALGHHYRRAFNEGVQAAVWALESLTKGAGDGNDNQR